MEMSSLPSSQPAVLIVDDQIQTVQILATLLENHGYSVVCALSGQDALKRLNAKQPDLIVLDLFMPEMDGFELCERIKLNSNFQDIPILFLTASHDEKHMIKAFEKGSVDYIMKPFQEQEVLMRVNTHINLRRQKIEIQRLSHQFETIITHVQDGLLVIDQEGIIQFANPAAIHMFNKSHTELMGHHLGIPIVEKYLAQIEILRLNNTYGVAEITVADALWEGQKAAVVCLRDISDCPGKIDA